MGAHPSVNPDAPSAWLLPFRGCRRLASFQRRAGAPVTLFRWKTRPPYKALLWLSPGALILIWASTPTLFWPMIRDLYWASTGKQPLESQAAAALAHQWIFYDWIRTALIAVGFVASLLAVSRNADLPPQASRYVST